MLSVDGFCIICGGALHYHPLGDVHLVRPFNSRVLHMLFVEALAPNDFERWFAAGQLFVRKPETWVFAWQ